MPTNNRNPTTDVHDQGRNPVCWAYAMASAIRQEFHRLGINSVPEHSQVVDNLVKEHGNGGLSTPNMTKINY